MRLLRSPLLWALGVAVLVAVAVITWISLRQHEAVTPPRTVFRFVPTSFAALPGWSRSDPSGTLVAFRRSCAEILKRPSGAQMGVDGYAGEASDWFPPCKAVRTRPVSSAEARAFFETWFVPVEVDRPARFTGYYEPELSGSRVPTQRYRVPIYGRPRDLLSADLGAFRHNLEGEHIWGRVEGTKLVPYPTRAEIDAYGLATAPVLLYTDDPVSAFFLQIQGSGLVKLNTGEMLRLGYAAKNGRAYTPVGRVLIAQGALERKNVSMQSIRVWLDAHPHDAQRVMEADQSFVFFDLAPLGDPALGSPGTEGIPIAAQASLAVDPYFHALGTPIYVATVVPDADPAKPDHQFQRLLIAQDTGGAIKGPARGDIFFGAGRDAEAIAGRLNARGQFFVFVPKAVTAALGHGKDIPDARP
ncbi:MAG TPA: murein transglycosylase A [Rhizomicrobium sp.]|nr:murein transglycosylase A [Rhizomicrobium sp.]